MKTVLEANRYLRWAVKNLEQFAANECLRRCRMPYDIPAKYPDAKDAYAHTDHRFKGLWVPGAFAWWKTPTHWHVAICAYRKGYVFTTDQRQMGEITGHYDRVPLTQIHKTWGAEFVGFSLDVNDMTPVKMPRIRRRYP